MCKGIIFIRGNTFFVVLKYSSFICFKKISGKPQNRPCKKAVEKKPVDNMIEIRPCNLQVPNRHIVIPAVIRHRPRQSNQSICRPGLKILPDKARGHARVQCLSSRQSNPAAQDIHLSFCLTFYSSVSAATASISTSATSSFA